MTATTVHGEQHLRVLASLAQEPLLDGVVIGVAVAGCVVTLFGRVQRAEQRAAAERAALRVTGIVAVALELVEAPPDDTGGDDTTLARGVAAYLCDERVAPPHAVRASVEHARVTLKGEVDLFHQRAAIERGVRALPGVRGIINLVRVRPPESQADIDSKVQSAVIRELASLDPASAFGAARQKRGKESAMAKGLKILIIDDDDDFRSSLRPVLEGAGYAVFEGCSGREGLALLSRHGPDAIVLDIMMETNEEGYGVTQAIKYKDEYAAHRSTPILMVSSIEETPDDRYPRAVELEMIEPDAYFTKPLEIDRFLAALARILARRARA